MLRHALRAVSTSPQPQIRQRLFPSGVFLPLQIVDISVYFNDQRGLVTIKVDDESLNDLLPPKVDSQLIRPKFIP